MAGDQTQQPIKTTYRSYAAELPAWGIVLGAMAVSFWTQVNAVSAHSFARWESLIWGFSTDFGTIACLFLAREGAHRGTPTWGAWMLSFACAAMSVQYNVVSDIERGDWLGVEAHVWMPTLALGVWYWMLHGRHRKWEFKQPGWMSASTALLPNPTPERVIAPAQARRSITSRRAGRSRKDSKTLEDARRWLAGRDPQSVMPSELMSEFKVSPATAGRWLKDLRRPFRSEVAA